MTRVYSHSFVRCVALIALGGLALGCNHGSKSTGPVQPLGPNSWAPLPTKGAPQVIQDAGGVWTGEELVVWGTTYPNTYAGALNLESGRWRAISMAGSPSARAEFSTVWTGTEMIIWGGRAIPGPPFLVNTGGRYNPQTDRWQSVATEGAPKARRFHACVWTGHEMIVWGGTYEDTLSTEVLFDGERYDPATDTWTPVSSAGAPHCGNPRAVWTGTEMIVFGGDAHPPQTLAGGIYNLVTDSWRTMSFVNGPPGGECESIVWDGREMLVWGRLGLIGPNKYDPVTDQWTMGSATGAPVTLCGNAAIWTGTEMFLWGGHPGDLDYLNQGGLYNPVTDTWRSTPIEGTPVRRGSMVAVWTGTEVLIWGGQNLDRYFADGARYRP